MGHCAEACHAPQAPAQAVKGLWGCVVDVEGMGVAQALCCVHTRLCQQY